MEEIETTKIKGKTTTLWGQWVLLNHIFDQYEKASRDNIKATALFEPRHIGSLDMQKSKKYLQCQEGDENGKKYVISD